MNIRQLCLGILSCTATITSSHAALTGGSLRSTLTSLCESIKNASCEVNFLKYPLAFGDTTKKYLSTIQNNIATWSPAIVFDFNFKNKTHVIGACATSFTLWFLWHRYVTNYYIRQNTAAVHKNTEAMKQLIIALDKNPSTKSSIKISMEQQGT